MPGVLLEADVPHSPMCFTLSLLINVKWYYKSKRPEQQMAPLLYICFFNQFHDSPQAAIQLQNVTRNSVKLVCFLMLCINLKSQKDHCVKLPFLTF